MAHGWASRAALGGLLLSLSACYAGWGYEEPAVATYGTYGATVPMYVPPDIYARPWVWWEGRPAYWVDDRWYWQGPRGWTVFQRPPTLLERQRPYVQQAPPAPRAAPFAYPPPAVRVR
jgi:hypothetical protein